jgi:hypothetical protein
VVDLSKLASELSNLTVLEATELSKMLKRHWGILSEPKVPGGKGDAARSGPSEAADRKLVQELIFQPREIELRRLSKEEKKEKNPDFKIFKESKLCGYCELKSPRDDWLFESPDNDKTGESLAEMRHSPTSNNLARQIKNAAEQFDAINPNHDLPNVLILVNHAVGRSRSDLCLMLAGIPVPGGPNLFPLKLDHQKEVWAAARRIDLFLWVDPQRRFWQPLYANDALHRTTVCSLFGIQDEGNRSGVVNKPNE